MALALQQIDVLLGDSSALRPRTVRELELFVRSLPQAVLSIKNFKAAVNFFFRAIQVRAESDLRL